MIPTGSTGRPGSGSTRLSGGRTGLTWYAPPWPGAWASAASGTSRFGEFVEHWTAPDFEGYVDALGELATLDGQDDLVGEVLSHEVAFWDMALA